MFGALRLLQEARFHSRKHSWRQVPLETLQLFNFKRAPRARERQGTPGSAREAPNPYIYLKNAPDL